MPARGGRRHDPDGAAWIGLSGPEAPAAAAAMARAARRQGSLPGFLLCGAPRWARPAAAPMPALNRNQSAIAGLIAPLTRCVPSDCTANSAMRMPAAVAGREPRDQALHACRRLGHGGGIGPARGQQRLRAQPPCPAAHRWRCPRRCRSRCPSGTGCPRWPTPGRQGGPQQMRRVGQQWQQPRLCTRQWPRHSTAQCSRRTTEMAGVSTPSDRIIEALSSTTTSRVVWAAALRSNRPAGGTRQSSRRGSWPSSHQSAPNAAQPSRPRSLTPRARRHRLGPAPPPRLLAGLAPARRRLLLRCARLVL